MELNNYRPVPFYFINTTDPEELDLKSAREAMQALKAAGFGGLIFFNKPPTGFSAKEYLDDFWFEVTENFLLAARELDLQFWINDGFDFPPGDAAGRIEKRQPDLHQQYLWLEDDGRVSVRKAEWGFPAFEEKESSRLFIELVYEEYHKRLGQYFGNGITGFFSDADNRRYNFQTAKILGGRQYFPWSRHFADEFHRRFGYAIEPHLPCLLRGDATPVRRDYWQLAGDLYQQWFASNHQWCRQHGLKYSFHSSDTGPFSWQECPRSSVFTEGQPLSLFQHSDIPGTDHELLALDGGTHYDQRLFWPKVSFGGTDRNLHNPDFNVSKFDLRAKYAASAAFLQGKKRVLCEAFAATNWGADFTWLRRIAAWQILQGINFFVPHAVHHRLHGSSKYFAPPEFLHGSLRHGLREFNDWLAHFCQVACQGEYIAKLAVLDPTEQIWEGKTDTCAFFELCDRLNRQPAGYVIASPAEAANFPHCIDAFAQNTSSLPAAEVQAGNDVLAFMPRRLPDGSEFLLLGNIWGNTLWRGSIPFGKQNYELELYPGELAILGGPWEQYRKVVELPVLHEFNGSLQVHWESPNLIPLRKSCCWNNSEDIPDMSVQVPAALREAVLLDQQQLQGGEPVRVFSDEYWRYTISGSAGTHELTILEPVEFSEPVYLCGAFELDLTTQRDFHHSVFQFYHLQLFEPESVTLQLAPRKNLLQPGAWAEQGAPFYSGTVTYDLEGELNCSNVRLELPAVAGTCEVLWREQPVQRRIWTPFHYDLGEWRGKQRLQIRVHNTLANQFEAYQAPGGLLLPPRLLEIPH